MDSKKRTQILYDDPNSIFKAGKKIYLHELKGATLKTTKQFPEDISIGLKGADLLSSLIVKLQQINDITNYFYDGISNINFYQVYNLVSVRNNNKLVNESLNIINKLSKLPKTVFNEDDVYSLLSVFTDIKETIELIMENPEFTDTPYYRSRDFMSFVDNTLKLLQSLNDFILSLGVSTGTSVGTEQPQPQPVIIQQEEPIDLEPAPPLEGAGRFRVLSHRIRKQQPSPFKRFL